MGGLSRCEHPGWRPTLFVPPTEGSHESQQTLTMLAGATAAPLIALAVAACGNGGGASASSTMRRLARGSPPLGADPRLPTGDALLTDKRQ